MNKQLLLSILLLSTASLAQASGTLSQAEIDANIARKFGHLKSLKTRGRRIKMIPKQQMRKTPSSSTVFHVGNVGGFDAQQDAIDKVLRIAQEAEESALVALFAGQKCAAKDSKDRLGDKKKTNRGRSIKTHSSLQQKRAGVGGFTNTGRDKK